MASRAPRRTFATPFVLTLALPLGACVVDSTSHGSTAPNPPPPKTDPQPVPPAPKPSPDPVVVVNPPAPKQDTPPPAPARPIVMNPPRPQLHPPEPMDTGATLDRHWTVSRHGTKCTAFDDDACRDPNRKPGDPIPPCNPPTPTAYRCPAELADGASQKIVKHANQTKCFVDAPVFKCPPNAKCFPPPPREADCP